MADDVPKAQGVIVGAGVHRRNGVIVEAVRRLSDEGVGVDDITLRRPTLDDVFLALTGHAAEETEDRDEAAA
jgi:ABC-2 type transport system ATP-binding protein